MKSKVTKYFVFLILLVITIAGLYYLNLSNRHKAILKTYLSHKLGIVDNTWHITSKENSISLITPTMIIDNIYKSMEGPQVIKPFQLNSTKSDLIWITSFETKAINKNEDREISNDFICHTNIDFYDGEHYGRWGLNHRIGIQYPRLATMTSGIESYKFPKGFGFPVFSNENLFLATQTLNHNIIGETFSVKHEINIGFEKHQKNMKPLTSKSVMIVLPYNPENPFSGPTTENPNMCLPIETKNHSYTYKDGITYSGHWVIFPGKAIYKTDITDQLQLSENTTLHHIATHLHPFSETLAFRDKTIDSTLFISTAKNHVNKIGLKEITYFSSEDGIKLYSNHKYELVLKTNNTSNANQDMMASMFMFLYDKEMDEKIKKYNQKTNETS
ncbi:hypothetical protein Q4Q39_03700 [Flavivirga amylovorans]|uniref:Uncharacterized protein n=1 Tax=Flavivirga amylovorans TaxID=870486 RepID=A0ABT8WXX1_9FLAO|nr:hypothetical protein [Flavivirga amylovorans]MDO5986503.1 hypothetical protein [Flavivirga amylovorans]